MKEAASKFLAHKKIAVTGVSHNQNGAANIIYRKLRSAGYKVTAVNPNAIKVEGDVCYSNLKSIPEKPEAVVIVNKPTITYQIVKDCAALGINNVWMHNGMNQSGSSVSEEAVKFCHEHGITVIPGGCPMMFIEHTDIGHKVMRWMKNLTGSLPKEV
jgi:predicted CoA-binding protein